MNAVQKRVTKTQPSFAYTKSCSLTLNGAFYISKTMTTSLWSDDFISKCDNLLPT